MSKRITAGGGLTIGLDLGDKYSEACVVDGSGEVLETFRVRTTQAALDRALSRFESARVVLEVGTNSPWVSRLVARHGHEVVVANPRRVRLIAENDSKSDRFDAELLARLGRLDPSLLSTRLPGSSAEAFPRRVRGVVPDDFFPGLGTLLAMIEQLTAEVRAMDREVERLCRERYPETEILRQVKGVGPITALCFVLTLEDPNRFRSSRSVGAYLGLRPRQRDSGDLRPQLRITKAGDALLRRLLVTAAHYILGPFGPDTELRRFGLRLAERGGKSAKKRAVVAVARRLAVLLHRLWVTGEVYQPLGYAASHAEAA